MVYDAVMSIRVVVRNMNNTDTVVIIWDLYSRFADVNSACVY